jgi:hypothetical protein
MFYITFLCSYQFLGAFAKSNCWLCPVYESVCLSMGAHLHGTSQLPLDVFLWNLSIYWKLLRKVRFHKDLKRITDTYFKTHIHWLYLAHFFESEMFQTKLVEKIKMHTLCPVTIFEKLCCLWDNVEKCYHKWKHNTVHTQCMLVYKGHTHTLRICNT